MFQEIFLSLDEEVMSKLHFLLLPLESSSIHTDHLAEAVHVELPDKGCHVGVLVIIWEEGLGEVCLVLDQEGRSSLSPGYQVVWNIISDVNIRIHEINCTCVRIVHHLPQFGEEGRDIGRHLTGHDNLHHRHHLGQGCGVILCVISVKSAKKCFLIKCLY